MSSTSFLLPMTSIALLQGSQAQWISLLPMVAIFAIFYFLLVAPMRKRQKSLQQLVENLKKGDRVVTSGGLYGEIAAVDASTVILKVADNVKLKVAKSAIAGLEGDADKGVKP
jgi:preprotein translocase subunit YajC